jgi:Ca-activated chloride channel family protein
LANGAPARIFPILFGEANSAEMGQLASFTGGRAFDGRKAVLSQVFKEIRGYQ